VVSDELAKSSNVSASLLDQPSNSSIRMAGAGGVTQMRSQPGTSPMSSPSNRRKVEKLVSVFVLCFKVMCLSRNCSLPV
jgi:hypothetical protein